MDYNIQLEANRRFMFPMGNFGPSTQRLSRVLVEKNVPHSPLDPIANAPQMCRGMLSINGSFQRFADSFTSSFSKPNIRKQQKERLKELIRPGHVIQVCGAPLVGKSTFVSEVLDDLCSHPQGQQRFIQHHIDCKGLSSFSSILSTLYDELQIKGRSNIMAPVHQIQAALREWLDCHHVFIFHKCEAIKANQEHFRFSDFLGYLSRLPNTTVIFTTYKLLLQQSNMHTLRIEMLSDASEIQALLNFFSQVNLSTQGPGYVSLLLKSNLSFPLAIRYFAQVYLQGSVSPQPEEVEDSIHRNSSSFLEECLGHRLSEINSWLQVEKLKWIVHFCHSLDASFSEELLWKMTEENRFQSGWNETMAHLEENFAVCHEPGLGRLRFHPLVVLYFMKALESQTLVLRGDWFDQSCNKVVKFLCNILDKTDMVSRYHGNKFALLKCLLPEWCNMKTTIQMAIHRKDYKAYWKVATMGASLLIKWSPDEAIDFYTAMFESSRQNGFRSLKETAVLEGCLAYAFAERRACHWKIARQHFHSSLDVLRREDSSFHTSKILCNFAHMLTRQGKTKKSQRFFRESQELLMKSVNEEDDDQFYMSDWQREELAMTINILKNIPRIFHGDNVEALKSLHLIMQEMEDKNLYHFDYSTVLNLMGLAVQRGNGNLDRAIFYYRQSLEERMHLINVCPQELVVPYNNLSMLQAKRGQTDKALQNLFNALSIRQRTGWKDYYTALTLIHIADIFLKEDKLVTALDYYSQADDILSETSKNHDLRLRLNLNLAHTTLALDQKFADSQSAYSGPCPCELGQQSSSISGQTKSTSATSSGTNFSHMNAMAARVCFCNCQKSLDFAFPHRRSAKDYFRKVYSLAKQSKGTLSDHGHCQLISSVEHLILLEWGNLPQILKYRSRIEEIMTTYAWVIEELKKPEKERNRFMTSRYEFFEYLSRTEPNHLDFKHLVEAARASCDFCENVKKYFSDSALENYILQSIRNREKSLTLSDQCGSEPYSVNSSEFLSQTDSDFHSPSRSQGKNSLDLYMNMAFNSSSTDKDSSCNFSLKDDFHTTGKKCCETEKCLSSSDVLSLAANPIQKQREGNTSVSCVSDEDNLHCDLGYMLENGHRSIEETSWHSHSLSLSASNHGQENTTMLDTTALHNIPYFSVINSLPSENEFNSLHSQTQSQSSPDDSDCVCDVSDDSVWTNLRQAFTPASNTKISHTHSSRLYDNDSDAYIFDKNCSSTETFATSLLDQDGVYCHKSVNRRDDRAALRESGYDSDGSSTVNSFGYAGRPNTHTYHGSFSAFSNSGYRLKKTNNVRTFDLQEDNLQPTIPLIDSSSPRFNRNFKEDNFTTTGTTSNGSCVCSHFIGRLHHNNGNIAGTVCVDNNQNLDGTVQSVVTEDFSKLSSEDKQDCGYFETVPGFEFKQGSEHFKKMPSEQDERDIK